MSFSLGLSGFVAQLLKIAEPSARFLLGLYCAYIFSFLYQYYIYRHTALLKNLFLIFGGVSILFYIYESAIWHVVLDVVVVYLLLWLLGGGAVAVVITWIVTMGHLLAGYAYIMLSNEVHPIAWTIPHCVLVLKLIGLSYNLYDGNKKQDKLSDEQKMYCLPHLPPFMEVCGFCFFPGSVLAGPQISYLRYQQFVNGELFNPKTTPSSSFPGLQRLLIGIGFSVFYSVLNNYYPIDFLATQGFADEPFFRKLWLVFITGKVALWRYVTVWLIAEGACIVCGISYKGVDKGGRVDWSALTNIKLIEFETCITLQGVVDSFNINTNQWVARYVYKRLKWTGNKNASLMLTLVFISFWHGLWPGYHINFTFEFIGLLAEKTFIKTATVFLGVSLSSLHAVLRLPLTVLAYTLKSLLLMYPLTCFMLLTWDSCYMFMKSVYFYGHVVTFLWFVTYWLLLWQQKRSRRLKAD